MVGPLLRAAPESFPHIYIYIYSLISGIFIILITFYIVLLA